ncbi:helix-turn-helix domain-containing protein [Clostridium tagluense]|uniref:CdaR family transcriptional regulator n=1 Tax=Clostridium tagluense TaxID=360422 RepID=UPI001C0AF252|nr:sugar diacid recognition domain-containing protein [Clostridium tagluense]MBU3128222.1 helix-turn-helix domain-containing protein [Clostridium tagluense]MCB2314063.1 helix-turn-helix domain-containing protein [Clostridium tagluense]MCB2318889.1 helix-turn-helix domain-containing protein [Clostridium tagluense]MCB2323795.1 helix-turn-helix domain-containing protein [Clostridium tagluense]MCB2328610.1 helix-turn-helix domain-containing protein [Clostridium tagluense]
MITLTEQQAQSIVDRMMNVIPYNVNIMNEKGIIIGSGDKNRLYKLHEGAMEAIAKKNMIEILQGGLDTKPGVNTPILFQNKVVGVIGITGKPEEVRPFVELVRITAELLVNQEYVLFQKKISEQLKDEFLYELTYRKINYNQDFKERGDALGIDVSIPRVAVVLTFNESCIEKVKGNLLNFIRSDEFFLKLNPSTIVIYMYYDSLVTKRLERFLCKKEEHYLEVGVGLNESVFGVSFKQANTAIEIGKKLQVERKIHLYKDVEFISLIASFKGNSHMENIIVNLEAENKLDLLTTLITYINMNGQANKTAEALYIHRNTLNYRLEKVEEVTGKNPKNLIDLFQLYTAYILSEI